MSRFWEVREDPEYYEEGDAVWDETFDEDEEHDVLDEAGSEA